MSKRSPAISQDTGISPLISPQPTLVSRFIYRAYLLGKDIYFIHPHYAKYYFLKACTWLLKNITYLVQSE